MKYLLIFSFFILFSFHSQAQTYFHPDRHSTNSFDGWISCTATMSPNTDRGISHWTMYDLGQDYLLTSSHIWNVNDPDNLDAGTKDLAIDYSDDGVSWTSLGIFNMDQSDGSLYYQGTVGPHFANIRTRYILLTSIENYGGTCYGFSEIKINVTSTPLPLTLHSFEVNCLDQNTNQISWTTESEHSIEKMEIERSKDAINWTSIHTVLSKGDKEEKSSYQTKDIVNNTYYYRIKSSDTDGKITYSDIVTTDCNTSERGLSVSPNPANNISYISFGSKELTTYTYILYDINGKSIHTATKNTEGEHTKFSIDTNQYPAGEYYVHIQLGDELLVKKLIVL